MWCCAFGVWHYLGNAKRAPDGSADVEVGDWLEAELGEVLSEPFDFGR